MSSAAIRAPGGNALSCKGWEQEAALRMLMNRSDPDVAEPTREAPAASSEPEHLRATLAALRQLDLDQCLVVRAGQPAGVFRIQGGTPRVVSAPEDHDRPGAGGANWLDVGMQSALPIACESLAAAARKYFGGTLGGRLIAACGLGTAGGPLPLAATLHGGAFLGIDADAEQIKRRVKTGYCEAMVNDLDEALRILKNSVRKQEPASVGLIGNCAEVVPELAGRGIVPDLLLDCTSAAALSGSYIPRGFSAAQTAELRRSDPPAYREKTLESMAAQAKATIELQRLGSLTYRLSGGRGSGTLDWRAQETSKISDFSAEFIDPLFAEGRALLLWVALSGEPADLSRADLLARDTLAGDEAAVRFLALAGRHVQFQGLPARVCLVDRTLRAAFGMALNEAVARGSFRAPILIGCDDPEGHAQAPPGLRGAGRVLSEAEFNSLLAGLSARARAASWVRVASEDGPLGSQLSLATIADGSPEMAARIACVLGTERS